MNPLRESWQRPCREIGAHSEGLHTFDDLISRYSEPHRKYHSLQHLAECISWFESVTQFAHHPAEVEAALWFHDAIYDVHRHDNEELSASWAQASLLEAGVSPACASRVRRLVLATKHTALPVSPDEQLLVDIDLSILAAAEPRFAEYEQQIRAEYSFVPDNMFWPKRQAILRSFLDRTFIYSTEHFRSQLEERARANLQRALGRLCHA
jgi:predicted metal-dependent HD superfamily phosphohydrolase